MNLLELLPRLLIGPLVLMTATALPCCEMHPDDPEIEFADIGSLEQGLVEFTYFSGHTREGGVLLAWGTRSESNSAGFNLYRRVSGEGDFAQINETLIPAKSEEGAQYEYLDEPLGVGLYDFQMEEVDNQGNVTPQGGYFSVAVFGPGGGDDGDAEDSPKTEDDTENSSFDCGIVVASGNKNRVTNLLWLLATVL